MKNKIQAFTLLEALIVIAVFSILMTMALPGMQSILRNNEITSRNNDLVTALQYTRSESIKLSDRVVLCASTSAMTAAPICSTTANDWLDGWVVFHDTNNDAVFTPGTDNLLKQFPSIASNQLTLRPAVLRAGDPQTIVGYVSFAPPRGEPMDINGTNQSGIFVFCIPGDNTKIRGVMMHTSGRIYSSRDSDTLGAHITCNSGI
ncbi:MAG: GspH/FimT family pseudopilin [Gammaproteobacteria bacterium]|nr:GspH/FimT family pseudopilin [Gammaproteobacteria bacterium]